MLLISRMRRLYDFTIRHSVISSRCNEIIFTIFRKKELGGGTILDLGVYVIQVSYRVEKVEKPIELISY